MRFCSRQLSLSCSRQPGAFNSDISTSRWRSGRLAWTGHAVKNNPSRELRRGDLPASIIFGSDASQILLWSAACRARRGEPAWLVVCDPNGRTFLFSSETHAGMEGGAFSICPLLCAIWFHRGRAHDEETGDRRLSDKP